MAANKQSDGDEMNDSARVDSMKGQGILLQQQSQSTERTTREITVRPIYTNTMPLPLAQRQVDTDGGYLICCSG